MAIITWKRGCLLFWSLWLSNVVYCDDVSPIQTCNGLVQGAVSSDGTYVQYFQIPYATAERFKVAEAASSWEGTLNATTNKGIMCPQREYPDAETVIGQEDCLYLNVYTPVQNSSNLPVMVYIHGGGFVDGSGLPTLYGPKFLVAHEVILVTINYRLDVLGFLNLGTEDAPTNVGIRDQTEALKWVQNNIEAFGGDPNNVTLFGESSGSVSVMYHLLSPTSSGLFQKAILQSGSALSGWDIQREPLKTAQSYVKLLGSDTEDPTEIYELLMTKTPEELLKVKLQRTTGNTVLSEYFFQPCVDTDVSDLPAFLPDDPYTLLSSGSYNEVPIMIGFTNAEGFWFASNESDTTIAEFDIATSLPNNLLLSDTDKTEVAEQIENIYFANNSLTRNKTDMVFLSNLANFEGDTGFIYPIVEAIDVLINTSSSPVYSYKFAYTGTINFVKLLSVFAEYPGATHGDDVFYLFHTELGLPTDPEADMINKMTTMWTNFAKFGDPTPETTTLLPTKWEPTTTDASNLLVIDSTFSTEPIWSNERLTFWRSLYEEYGRRVSWE